MKRSLLAAAYAQRGFVFTLKRNLEQAQMDLDQAIKVAPDYAEAYVNRAPALGTTGSWLSFRRYCSGLIIGGQVSGILPRPC